MSRNHAASPSVACSPFYLLSYPHYLPQLSALFSQRRQVGLQPRHAVARRGRLRRRISGAALGIPLRRLQPPLPHPESTTTALLTHVF